MSKAFKWVINYIKNTDLYLLLLALTASGMGLMLIYSATRTMEDNKPILVQSAAILIGLIAFVILSLVDLEDTPQLWKFVFIANILFQLSVLFIGKGEGGNRSWIRFGPIGIQPGEVGKLLFIYTFSQHLILLKDNINHWKSILLLLCHIGLMSGSIIFASKDVGVALSYPFIGITMIFAAGISLKWIAAGGVMGVASVPFVWKAIGKFQQERILVLFDHDLYPNRWYQQGLSQTAIGAGRMYGEGFLNGNVVQLGSLPAKHTDFIFAVCGEEWGFIGCTVLIGVLSLIILRLFYVSYRARDPFSALLCVGIGSMLLFQICINLFMCLGIAPVLGQTLPFISYGGSSIVTCFMVLGAAAGVRMRAKPSWLR